MKRRGCWYGSVSGAASEDEAYAEGERGTVSDDNASGAKEA